MDEDYVEQLVAEWDDVYKKGQLSLWILLAIADGRKYSAQITDFMTQATGGSFDIKEQSLYRALRRFEGMRLVSTTKEDSPSSGTQRKYYELTATGEEVLRRFMGIHIAPLYEPKIVQLIQRLNKEGKLS